MYEVHSYINNIYPNSIKILIHELRVLVNKDLERGIVQHNVINSLQFSQIQQLSNPIFDAKISSKEFESSETDYKLLHWFMLCELLSLIQFWFK